jgi:release factor glutamine methyltransferase
VSERYDGCPSALPKGSPTTASRSSLDLPAVVATLRAAGCVFAEEEAQLLLAEAQTPESLAGMVEERVDGLPLEHILGWAQFCGLRIAVDPGVFVPRRRTEFLVDQAAEHARPILAARAAVVLDLCCGSGALGLALVAVLGSSPARVELHCADVDPAATRCAVRNVAPVGGQVYQGDLFEPLPTALRGRVDVVLANVPYVPTDEVELMPPEARLHEARPALDGGTDGLDVLRRVCAGALRWLAPGGLLLFETSERQVQQALAAIAGGGLAPAVARSEELYATVVTGTMPTR